MQILLLRLGDVIRHGRLFSDFSLPGPVYCTFLFVARCGKSTISASSVCLPKSRLRTILLVSRVNQSRCEQNINLYA